MRSFSSENLKTVQWRDRSVALERLDTIAAAVRDCAGSLKRTRSYIDALPASTLP